MQTLVEKTPPPTDLFEKKEWNNMSSLEKLDWNLERGNEKYKPVIPTDKPHMAININNECPKLGQKILATNTLLGDKNQYRLYLGQPISKGARMASRQFDKQEHKMKEKAEE